MQKMKFKDYRLDKQFDILGIWYLEGDTIKNGVSGILHYNNENIELELFGAFGSETISFNGDVEYVNILGFSQNGKHLMLNNCMLTNNQNNYPGFSVNSYSIDTFFIFEVHDNERDWIDGENKDFIKNIINNELLIDEYEFGVNHLSLWLENGGIESYYSLGDDKRLKKMGIQYDSSKNQTKKFPIPIISMMLRENVRVKNKLGKNLLTASFDSESTFKLLSLENQINFFNAYEKSDSIVKLLELLNTAKLHFEFIEFISKGKINDETDQDEIKPYIKGRYFFRQIGEKNNNSKFNVRFKLTDIDTEFEKILDNWFRKSDELESVVNNYLSDLYIPNYFLETKFLNSIRSLEVYYRNFVNIENEDSNEQNGIDEMVKKITDYVSETVPNDLHDYFIERINFVEEGSLRKKLTHLISGLPDEFFDKNFAIKGKKKSKRKTSLVNSLVQTRNYYTHGDKDEKFDKKIDNIHELLEINNKLRKVIEYYIYKELGLNDDIILANIEVDNK